jgi:nucleotide-binding universal stress UspA family protein
METILCPTDFSASSLNAIHYAEELAARLGARLVLFHNIAEPIVQELVSAEKSTADGTWRYQAQEEEKKVRLEALKKALENSAWGEPTQYETILRHGVLQETIPQVAREQQADLIVIGNEGAEALKEIFVGSVAENLTKSATCPVLIVPPHATFKPLNKIVFATDLGGEPFVDVQWILNLAALFDAELLFVHVLASDRARYQLFAENELHRLYKNLPYKNAAFYLEENPSVEEGISQFCRRHKADMLVMGSHPHRLWQHLLAENAAGQMAYHTYLPLLVIHYKN